MPNDDEIRKTSLCDAIRSHLRTHANAADTAEGILASWLPGEGFEDAPDHIGAALEQMLADRWLRAVPLPDGRILYVRGDASSP